MVSIIWDFMYLGKTSVRIVLSSTVYLFAANFRLIRLDCKVFHVVD